MTIQAPVINTIVVINVCRKLHPSDQRRRRKRGNTICFKNWRFPGSCLWKASQFFSFPTWPESLAKKTAKIVPPKFFEDYLDLVSLLNFPHLTRKNISHNNHSFLIINQLLIINDYNYPYLTRENGNREEITGKTNKSNTGHQDALGKYTTGREAAKYYLAIFSRYPPPLTGKSFCQKKP